MHMPGGDAIRRVRSAAQEHANVVGVPFARRLGLGDLIRATAREAVQDDIGTYAGNLAYNAFLAIFPFLLFVVSILKVINGTHLVVSLVDAVSRTLPSSAAHLVRHQILPEILSRLTSSPILSVLLALGSLWAASAVVRALMSALNAMYEVEEARSGWLRLVLSIVLSLAAAALFLAALGMIVLGPLLAQKVGALLGSGWVVGIVWNAMQWVLLLAFALLAFGLLYYFAPAATHPFRFVGPGAVVATAAWVVFSIGFSLLLNAYGRNLIDPLYGWFAGVIVLLLYMYWSAVILLVGAEINAVILRANDAASRGEGRDEAELRRQRHG